MDRDALVKRVNDLLFEAGAQLPHETIGRLVDWLSVGEEALGLLPELEFVDGDDLSFPSCRFCGACGPDRNPAHPSDADPHEPDCPLARLLGRPTRTP